MNIALAGNGPLPALAYDRMIGDGYDVVAGIYDDDGDFPQRCEWNRLPYMPTAQLAVPHIAVPFLRACGADLLILANVTTLLPEAVFTTPRLGTICFHPSILPRHRGKNAVRDTLAAGDIVSGVSVFRVDSGIDTGPVLTSRTFAVPPGISAGGLYYRHLVPLGVEAILDAVRGMCAPTAMAAD